MGRGGGEGGGGRGRAEIERVVSLQTVTESEPLSCCQEKNTEAHINSAVIFLVALHPRPPHPSIILFLVKIRRFAHFAGFYDS